MLVKDEKRVVITTTYPITDYIMGFVADYKDVKSEESEVEKEMQKDLEDGIDIPEPDCDEYVELELEIDPELHRLATLRAAESGRNLDKYIEDAISWWLQKQ